MNSNFDPRKPMSRYEADVVAFNLQQIEDSMRYNSWKSLLGKLQLLIVLSLYGAVGYIIVTQIMHELLI